MPVLYQTTSSVLFGFLSLLAIPTLVITCCIAVAKTPVPSAFEAMVADTYYL
jgi:predicted membrane chloride channel (bestrophin family)